MNMGEEGKSAQLAPPKSQKYFMAAQFFLRLLGTAATLAATWIMVTSKQSVVVFGSNFDAKYSYSPAFRFFALANLLACVFSAVSLGLTCVLGRKAPNYFFFVFLHDMVVMTLLMAGCAAATAIGYLGRYGNKYTGWSAICGYFEKYCNRVTVSMSLSYFGFLVYFCLTIVSANKSRQIIK